MNGAQALIRTLVACGVDTCFMNPGTSEMHFVAALDAVPEMHSVLALFEGVATGAADGYGRMADRPAATLLHLGPGLGNGLANLHNARKGQTPVVNIVGDHATYHKQYNAQLESDIDTVARNVSSFIRWSAKTGEVGNDAADTVAAAFGPPGQVATLVLPADISWGDGGEVAKRKPPQPRAPADDGEIRAIAEALRSGEPAALFVGGTACRASALAAARAIADASGAKLLCETFPARIERGAGRVPVDRIAYLAEFAAMQLDGLRHLVLVDAKAPVSFFAYPDKASWLSPEGCEIHTLAGPADDAPSALAALADALGASEPAARQQLAPPDLPSGPLTAQAVCAALGALLPEGAIVSDEGNTSGLFAAGATAGAPPHDWLCLTGGAIGQGLPVAVGAAVACPDRRVVALESDGSAMYTLQSLWTMAREGLDVTTILFNNGSYAVLNMELGRVGAEAGGPRAKAMLDIRRPDLDFVSLAQGMGVSATRATTAEDFNDQLARGFSAPGPSLIEAVVPSIV
ncbi:MAG: acetolactate synthase large subunit [Actinomycetota bacterium]|nr:acetolactate synthase large subunit [Actinomycetota bacterium]